MIVKGFLGQLSVRTVAIISLSNPSEDKIVLNRPQTNVLSLLKTSSGDHTVLGIELGKCRISRANKSSISTEL
ncbi:Uncharacterised protein [Chlamydia trachomatis]|nr:Uncharacterised protein [Chlamydia trachomatis]CRI74450.1 Uncharacterised protein [Chlamydia trachomatis]